MCCSLQLLEDASVLFESVRERMKPQVVTATGPGDIIRPKSLTWAVRVLIFFIRTLDLNKPLRDFFAVFVPQPEDPNTVERKQHHRCCLLPPTCRGVGDHQSILAEMHRFVQKTRKRNDLLQGGEEHYDNYAVPPPPVPYGIEGSAGWSAEERQRAKRMLMQMAASANEPVTSDSKKAVASAEDVTSAEAMNSTKELCLYLMDTCVPHCCKTCTSCQPRWSDQPSPEAEKAHIAEMENGHGIVKRISPKEDHKTVRVDIQNKHMKDILTNVFDGYPGFNAPLLPADSAWVFNEPFKMFVGRWDQIRANRLRTPFAAEKAAWVALFSAMTPVVQPTLDSIKRIRDTGLVRWNDLSLIFPLGKLILVEELGGVQSVVRVLEGKLTFQNPQYFHSLAVEYVDWDGEKYGLHTRTLDIPQYNGHKMVGVSDLSTMPLDFCPLEEALRTKLIARGRR